MNGHGDTDHVSRDSRADEIDVLLKRVQEQLIPYIRAADDEVEAHRNHDPVTSSSLVDAYTPPDLSSLLSSSMLILPDEGVGQEGLLKSLESILKYSVNPSAPGFLDKLYASPLPPGIVADLILSVLNTNLHVYHVSPVLTLIERHVTRALADMFRLKGPRAGGINLQGGSASNMTSIVIARNSLFPETKLYGNHVGGGDLVLFTSQHGHYSIEKAAQACGFGSKAVVSVPVDAKTGAMIPAELERLVQESLGIGKIPFYVNATAGTTVLGSFDPFMEISAIAKRYGMWMHIDGAWGGSFVFHDQLRASLRGSELADSIAINPHKMMGVPVTCSFLLGKDMKQFHDANTLPADYLFHDDEPPEMTGHQFTNGHSLSSDREGHGDWKEPYDLADLTLQCGRRGDSLKLFLSWQYYGTKGYHSMISNAYDVACHLAGLVQGSKDMVLVSENPPPCLQVCFYYAPGRRMVFGEKDEQSATRAPLNGTEGGAAVIGKRNSSVTEKVAQALVRKGFMIDFAPALEGQEEKGKFFRVVVNIRTEQPTVERLIEEINEVGGDVVNTLKEHMLGTPGC